MDEAMREGMMNVLHDDRLFTHYWADAGQLEASMAARARPDAEIDLDSFFAVLTDFGERGATLLSTGPVTTPTLTLFGARDRVTPFEEQHRAVHGAIPHASMEVLDGCSHYVHLDRPGHFVETVVNWAAVTEAGRPQRS
jgi:pimeloyl-ACP methyl ester carboxylesterase